MKRELFIFIFVLVGLSLLVHFDAFISHPFEHILNLSSSGAYGLGWLHPLVFTFVVYILLWIPRLIGKAFKRK